MKNSSSQNFDIKKLHEGLIDKQGRRKYFKQLNPKLVEAPFEVNLNSSSGKGSAPFSLESCSANCLADRFLSLRTRWSRFACVRYGGADFSSSIAIASSIFIRKFLFQASQSLMFNAGFWDARTSLRIFNCLLSSLI